MILFEFRNKEITIILEDNYVKYKANKSKNFTEVAYFTKQKEAMKHVSKMIKALANLEIKHIKK